MAADGKAETVHKLQLSSFSHERNGHITQLGQEQRG